MQVLNKKVWGNRIKNAKFRCGLPVKCGEMTEIYEYLAWDFEYLKTFLYLCGIK